MSDSTTMFYGASPKVFEYAKVLRKKLTKAELILWEVLKGKKILGLRFRRQHPLSTYIADFYCHPIKLVVEVDGGIHNNKGQMEYDIGREVDLNNYGISVIRFTNSDVENDLLNVIKKIKHISEKRMSIFQSPL